MRRSVLFATTLALACVSNIGTVALAASDDPSAIIELPLADDANSATAAQHEAPLPTVVSYHDVTEGMLPKVSGVIQEKISSGYVYQPTGEVVSRSVTSEFDAAVTVGKVSSELYLLDTRGYNEQEVNFYYADSFKKTPVGKIDFSLMTGAWREPDGWIVPVYGEVSHDIAFDKGFMTLTPFAGFGQWLGIGQEANLGYLQGGLRSSWRLSSRLSLTTETAYSHCFQEVSGSVDLRPSIHALPTLSDCRSVPYGNTALMYDLGKKFSVVAGVQATKHAPTSFGLTLRKTF